MYIIYYSDLHFLKKTPMTERHQKCKMKVKICKPKYLNERKKKRKKKGGRERGKKEKERKKI